MPATAPVTLYGAAGSGSIAVEAAMYLPGHRLPVLDRYVTVVSRFGPWRHRFYEAAPGISQVVRRVDQDPRLAVFWRTRFPFREGLD